jgi:hypothetical protein
MSTRHLPDGVNVTASATNYAADGVGRHADLFGLSHNFLPASVLTSNDAWLSRLGSGIRTPSSTNIFVLISRTRLLALSIITPLDVVPADFVLIFILVSTTASTASLAEAFLAVFEWQELLVATVGHHRWSGMGLDRWHPVVHGRSRLFERVFLFCYLNWLRLLLLLLLLLINNRGLNLLSRFIFASLVAGLLVGLLVVVALSTISKSGG